MPPSISLFRSSFDNIKTNAKSMSLAAFFMTHSSNQQLPRVFHSANAASWQAPLSPSFLSAVRFCFKLAKTSFLISEHYSFFFFVLTTQYEGRRDTTLLALFIPPMMEVAGVPIFTPDRCAFPRGLMIAYLKKP
jgi:hypothetical protein